MVMKPFKVSQSLLNMIEMLKLRPHAVQIADEVTSREPPDLSAQFVPVEPNEYNCLILLALVGIEFVVEYHIQSQE